MRGVEPRLSQFGPAIRWLLAKDVVSSRLAALFSTTPENIRVIAFRSKHAPLTEVDIASLTEKPDAQLANSVGIRPTLDNAAWTPSRNRRIEWLRNEV